MPQLPLLRLSRIAVLVTVPAVLGGCSSLSDVVAPHLPAWILPYKVEVVQGNVVTSEQLAQIKPGRSRNDVREILGSPLVADVFHAQRWDYVFTLSRAGQQVQRRAVAVMFEGDVVKSVETATAMPTEHEFVASITRPDAGDSGPPPKFTLSAEERAALPKPSAASLQPPAGPVGAVRTYPPLESPK